MIDRKTAIQITKKCMNSGLSKQVSIMINSGQYNNARYFVSDEIDSTRNKDTKKSLNILEDYLISQIENTR